LPIIAPFRGLCPVAGRFAVATTWPLGAPPSASKPVAATPGHSTRDRTPAFYRYELTYGPPESRRHATAFFARLALDEGAATGSGSPSPSTTPTLDAEPVVYRYVDERGWVDEILSSNAFDELVRATDANGNEHRIWRVERPEGVAEVVAQFEERALRLESGAHLLATAQIHAGPAGGPATRSVLALLAPEGPATAPWRAGFILSPRDEGRPRAWTELAGDPGKAKWRMPSLD